MKFCDVINERVPNKAGKLKNYTCGDCNYDLCAMWSLAVDEAPAPIAHDSAAFVVADNKWIRLAEDDAVHPIVDYSEVRGVVSVQPFDTAKVKRSVTWADGATAIDHAAPGRTTPPTARMEQDADQQWIHGHEQAESVARLTITEREMLHQHIDSHEDPNFVAEYHTPDGVVSYVLMKGKAPSGHDLSMPTIAGPTSYKAAMKSANWRGWLADFIAEIEGQIKVGTFHWAVAPEEHKLLNSVCVFTQKLHADYTHERGKCRVVVDDSRGKPGEYADVSAHVAQLASWKF
jgi:hypothetical protein